jgi:hypothetical protein
MPKRVPTAFQQPAPFIVGVPRSGTTLLRFMLDAHSQLAIPPETGFLPELIQKRPHTPLKLVSLLSNFHTWPDFGITTDQLLNATHTHMGGTKSLDLTNAVRSFFTLYAHRHGKKRWGDKTPTYLRHMVEISKLIPEARFVHIIRDGRDVAVSVRPLFFSPSSTIAGIAQDWVTNIRVARKIAKKVPYYLEVTYESLVNRPEPVLRQICEFIELPFESGMLNYYQNVAKRLLEHQSRFSAEGKVLISHQQRVKNQELTMRAPQTNRIGRWRQELTGLEIAEYHDVAGELLKELGYSTS